MSVITTVSIQRAGKIVASGQAVQFDLKDPRAIADMSGESMYDLFTLISFGPMVPIRRQDLLIDEQNIDPLTNTNVVYRVFGQIETFTMMAHTEAEVELITGLGGK